METSAPLAPRVTRWLPIYMSLADATQLLPDELISLYQLQWLSSCGVVEISNSAFSVMLNFDSFNAAWFLH